MTALNETTYHSLIAGEPVTGTGGVIHAIDPAAGAETGPGFTLLAQGQLKQATSQAAAAFASYRALTPQQRADFLNAVAERIDAGGADIVQVAMTETGLPEGRLQGELARTVNQLRLFAKVCADGDHHGVRIEPALPQRTPLPRPDLRQRRIPLGPVGVFGASNFPLAFSVAGGDTASALAAGCPVVFKAHNAHPGTAQLVGQAVSQAVKAQGLHTGVFSLVYGRGTAVGQELVADDHIRAVGFTGSRSGGTSLMATAAKRREPIPVYAEMSSVNPIFVLGSALTEGRIEDLAKGFVDSLNGSAGQLCTVPGLIFVPKGEAGDAFVVDVAQRVEAAVGTTMLTPGICASRGEGEQRLAGIDAVTPVGRGRDGEARNAPAPAVYTTDVGNYLADPALSEEIFGAVCLIVRYATPEDLVSVVDELEGQLTATLHLEESDAADLDLAQRMLSALELRVGRILVGGWPTGVDVGDAMVHGGPFPATSDGRSTSVGTAAIERFLRPVVYQNVPVELQPDPVRQDNPWNLERRVDGRTVLAEGEAR